MRLYRQMSQCPVSQAGQTFGMCSASCMTGEGSIAIATKTSTQIRMAKSVIFIAAIVLLASTCAAQVQGNLPQVLWAAQDRAGSNTVGSIVTPENVATGDLIVCGIQIENDTGLNGTYTFADTLANTWTATATTQTPLPVNNSKIWMEHTVSGSSGSDTITLTRTSGTDAYYLNCVDMGKNLAVDGAVATQTASSPGGGTVGTISTSNTTTANNDLLISITAGAAFSGHISTVGPNAEMLTGGAFTTSPPVNFAMILTRAGALGATTATSTIWADNNSTTFAMQTLAFKPSAILITDTVMPDGGNGKAYSAQLHGIGGTAAQTYSCTGLPSNGLSLNTSTGVISGSNPTTGTVSISCTTTDGVTTSSAAALSITIGTLQIPNVRQINNTWSGDNGGGSFTMNVQCGSTLLVFARGDDTHGTQGFVQSATGVNNKISDTLGSSWRRVAGPIAGNNSWPFVVYAARVNAAGSDTISVVNNQTASSSRTVGLALEITGGISVDDVMAALNSVTTTASFSIAPTYTTVVPNTMLISGTDSNGTLSIAAPFSVISSGGDITLKTLYATTIVASASSVTATVSGTGGASLQSNDALLVPIRPAIALAGCPANFGTGEKFRRQIF